MPNLVCAGTIDEQPCKMELNYDPAKGWPRYCPNCGSYILAPLPGPQELAAASKADLVGFGGGVFGGKSFTAAMKAREYCMRPNAQVLVLRLERAQILKGLWDKFEKVIFKHDDILTRQSSNFFDIRIPSMSSTIMFGGFKDLGTFKTYEGGEYALIIWDEAQQLSFEKFNLIRQRNRGPDGYDGPVQMFLTMNPPKPGDDGYWLRELFDWWLDDNGYPIPERMGIIRWFTIEQERIIWVEEDWTDDDGEPGTSVTFIQALAKDNPVGLAANPRYLSTLRSQTLQEQRRKKDGCWNVGGEATAFEGARIIWVEPEDMPEPVGGKIRAWDQGLGEKEYSNRNGTAGARGWLAHCPKCQGRRFVGEPSDDKALEPCDFCNFDTWVAPSDVDLERQALWIDHVVWEHQLTAGAIENLHIHWAKYDGYAVPQYIEQERGTSGKTNLHSYDKHVLPNHDVQPFPVSGSKVVRAQPLVALGQHSLVFIARGPWQHRVERAIETFTPEGKGEFKDIVDSMSELYAALLIHEWPTLFSYRM